MKNLTDNLHLPRQGQSLPSFQDLCLCSVLVSFANSEGSVQFSFFWAIDIMNFLACFLLFA